MPVLATGNTEPLLPKFSPKRSPKPISFNKALNSEETSDGIEPLAKTPPDTREAFIPAATPPIGTPAG